VKAVSAERVQLGEITVRVYERGPEPEYRRDRALWGPWLPYEAELTGQADSSATGWTPYEAILRLVSMRRAVLLSNGRWSRESVLRRCSRADTGGANLVRCPSLGSTRSHWSGSHNGWAHSVQCRGGDAVRRRARERGLPAGATAVLTPTSGVVLRNIGGVVLWDLLRLAVPYARRAVRP
jgi:hypothetical protein